VPGADPAQPAGCIVPFIYANHVGWVALFCLYAPYRGRGYGGALFKRLQDYFAEQGVTTIGLDAVQEQRETYARRGFREIGTVRVMSRAAVVTDATAATQDSSGNSSSSISGSGSGKYHDSTPPSDTELAAAGAKLVPLTDVPVEQLVASDLRFSGLERDKLWTQDGLFSRPDASGFALLDSSSSGGSSSLGRLRGWTLLRRCEHGWRLGPLYAETRHEAELVLRAAVASTKGSGLDLFVEVWVQNLEAEDFFKSLGWQSASVDYFRMWVDALGPSATNPGGAAEKGCFAIFDAAEG